MSGCGDLAPRICGSSGKVRQFVIVLDEGVLIAARRTEPLKMNSQGYVLPAIRNSHRLCASVCWLHAEDGAHLAAHEH